MQRMLAATPLSSGRSDLAHRTRAFNRPPDADQAAMLLAELATAPCAYSPVAADVPLAVYGAGNLGRLARDFLAVVGHKLVMVIDRDARRLAQEPSWSNVPLLGPDEAAEHAKDRLRIAVCVVTAPYVPIERSLQQLGFEDIVPFFDLSESFRSVHPLSNGWFAAPLTAFDREKTAEVLARWDDDVSRAHHLQFLAWRRLREEWSFEPAPVVTNDRFFVHELAKTLRGDEILLDAGAHHGSVTETFLRHTKGAFRQIIAIEPDPTNRRQLEAAMQRLVPGDTRASVCDFALSDEDGQALFHEGLGYASQLSGTGDTRVATRTIDALSTAPTFIKLHLEGAELAALKGARRTLLDCRPLIAATVYHNADGIWKTAAWLMQTLPRYRFLFRNHSWCGTGAVIYAIPDERAA
jgi:FkbM family methyltransferase